MERLFEAIIRNADTNEILTRISSFSQEGLEEEMGKTKWAKFADRDYEEIEETEEEELKKPDCLKTEDEINAALSDIRFDEDGNALLPDDEIGLDNQLDK